MRDAYITKIFLTLFSRGAGAVFVLLMNLAVSRILGAEEAGVFFLALTITMIFALISRAGIDSGVLKYAGIAYHSSKPHAASHVRLLGIVAVCFFSIPITIAMFTGAPAVAAFFSEQRLATILPVLSLTIIPSAFLNINASVLKAAGKPGLGTFAQNGIVPLIVSLCCLAILVQPAYGWIAFSFAGATFFAYAISEYAWRYVRQHVNEPVSGDLTVGELLKTSIPMSWVAAGTLIMSWTDLIVLGFYEHPETVGLYNAAARTVSVLTIMLIAVNASIGPQIAAYSSLNQTENLRRLARNSTALTFLLGAPLAIALIANPAVVVLLFGEGFELAAEPLVYLAAAQLFNLGTGPVSFLLMMSGRERVVGRVTTYAAVLNLGLNIAFVPEHGMVGAAIATAISITCLNLVLAYCCHRYLGILVYPIPLR